MIEESRFWGFFRLGSLWGQVRKEINPTGVGLTVFYKTPNLTLKVQVCMLVFFCDRNEIKRFLWRRNPRN